MRSSVLQACRFAQSPGQGKYLGLINHHGRCKREGFQSISDEMGNKFAWWKTDCLSMAGCVTLVQSVFGGALADIFLRGSNLIQDVRGMASLTGVLPPFVPFAQAFAAVLTAVLTGSLYYVAASPKDPTYVVAPVLQSRSGRQDLKKLFEAWYEKRQMRKIYSPLLEGLLALYLGFEWIQTNNILSPIITHGIYSTVILGHGLWKIHDHRRRLRQRIQQLQSDDQNSK